MRGTRSGCRARAPDACGRGPAMMVDTLILACRSLLPFSCISNEAQGFQCPGMRPGPSLRGNLPFHLGPVLASRWLTSMRFLTIRLAVSEKSGDPLLGRLLNEKRVLPITL